MEKSTISKLKEDFADLCVAFSRHIDACNSKNIINELKRIIRMNYNKNIVLQEVAKRLYINPVYLGRLFKKETGMQFGEYLCNVRIEEAKRLLRRTNMKISDIARNVGYNDEEYFAAKFRSLTRLSPSAYRKSVI